MDNDFNFTIWAQNDLIMDIRREDIVRNLRAVSCRIYFYNGLILAKYATCERAFEVWQALKQAALTGKEVFIFPKV